MHLLEHPDQIEEASIDELKALSREYPYSQPVQLLYAIRLRKSSEHLFNQQLGRASILTNDRSVLFDLFEKEEEQFMPSPEEIEKADTYVERFSYHEEKNEESQTSEEREEPVQEEVEEEEISAPLRVLAADEEEAEDSSAPESAEEDADDDQADEVKGDAEDAEDESPSRREERDINSLPADERIRAILERNRKLREDFEAKKSRGEVPMSDMDERLQQIRERLAALKRGGAEEPVKEEEPEENTAVHEQEESQIQNTELAQQESHSLEAEVEQELESLEEEVESESLEHAEMQSSDADEEEATETEEDILHIAGSPEEQEVEPRAEEVQELKEEEAVSEEELLQWDEGEVIDEEELVREESTEQPETGEMAEEEIETASEEIAEEEAEDEVEEDLEDDEEEREEQLAASAEVEEEREPEVDEVEDQPEEVEVTQSSATSSESETEAEREAEREAAQGRPQVIDYTQKRSFSEWLRTLNPEGDSAAEQNPNAVENSFNQKMQLLDSFVDKLPTLKKRVAPGPSTTPIEIGHLVNEGGEKLVTETLARVYIEQKHYDKAIKAYQILKLKYPEKSSFFAAQISEVKKLKATK